jgi:glyoxylase I family protein
MSEEKMSIDHVLAVVPVADFEAAHAWYERLFGRPADNLPMEGLLVEWRVTDSGWVQVTRDTGRAGSALLNFAVDDLNQHVAEVSGRGLALPGVSDGLSARSLSGRCCDHRENPRNLQRDTHRSRCRTDAGVPAAPGRLSQRTSSEGFDRRRARARFR